MTTKTPTAKAPRASAAQRAVAQKEAQAAKKEAQAAAEAAFERNKAAAWQGLWAKALHLALLLQDDEVRELRDAWWFDNFKVDARQLTFNCESFWTQPLSEATLTLTQAARAKECLSDGLGYYNDFLEKKDRERREREALIARKNAALAKLTDEERKLLNLPPKFA